MEIPEIHGVIARGSNSTRSDLSLNVHPAAITIWGLLRFLARVQQAAGARNDLFPARFFPGRTGLAVEAPSETHRTGQPGREQPGQLESKRTLIIAIIGSNMIIRCRLPLASQLTRWSPRNRLVGQVQPRERL